jgi:hypothetical protein
MTLARTIDHLRRLRHRMQNIEDQAAALHAEIFADPSAYYRAGLRDLLSASILHLLHQAGNAGLTVQQIRDSIRCETTVALDAFQRLHHAGLATAPQRTTGRGRPYLWTITTLGSATVTTPPLRGLTVQPILLP